MWRRVKNFGGLFLLFLLFCAIISSIQPDTATTTETISSTENTISFTENTISSAGDTISTEDTVTWAENTIFCTSIIDGDTFRLENGETVRLIDIDAPELSQPGGDKSHEYLARLIKGREYKGSPEIIVKTPDQIRIQLFSFFLFFFSSFCNFTL